MLRVLGLLLLVIICVAMAGYFLGWYNIGNVSTPQGGHTGVQVDVDKEKVKADIDKAKKRFTPIHAESESH